MSNFIVILESVHWKRESVNCKRGPVHWKRESVNCRRGSELEAGCQHSERERVGVLEEGVSAL